MKLALVTLLTVLSFATQADGSSKIERGDDFIIEVSNSKIISVKPVCGGTNGGAQCMAYGSQVVIEIPMSGCFNRFAGYNYSITEEKYGQATLLNFNAIEFFNKKSMTALCPKMPVHRVSLVIPYMGKIKLNKLEFKGTISAPVSF